MSWHPRRSCVCMDPGTASRHNIGGQICVRIRPHQKGQVQRENQNWTKRGALRDAGKGSVRSRIWISSLSPDMTLPPGKKLTTALLCQDPPRLTRKDETDLWVGSTGGCRTDKDNEDGD